MLQHKTSGIPDVFLLPRALAHTVCKFVLPVAAWRLFQGLQICFAACDLCANEAMGWGKIKKIPHTPIFTVHFEVAACATLDCCGQTCAADSFLSAAFFWGGRPRACRNGVQKQARPLYGLKENVILGKVISADTGLELLPRKGTCPARGNARRGQVGQRLTYVPKTN